jgi:peptide/nickel transport system substrate-binding protein
MPASRLIALLLSLLLLAACTPAGAPTPRAAESGSAAGSTTAQQVVAPNRTLVVVARAEPPTLAAKPLQGISGSLTPPLRLFNATLDYMDANEVPQPYLAQALPQLNSDTWRVMPDGKMETIHRLRPNLTWHDGTPLTAEDFVFAHKVYSTPTLGASASPPIGEMEEVVAQDPGTVLIRWKRPYPDAIQMDQTFQALPRHLLEQPYQTLDAIGFTNHPYWTSEYVGLGPYKVARWEAGAFIEATAFEGHALGKPRIERLRLAFIGDANTALANILTREAHYVSDYVLWYHEGVTLEREWSMRGGTATGGTVFFSPALMRATHIQQRPEFAAPQALLDVRVRRALWHAIDSPSAVEALTGGKGLLAATLSSPAAEYYPQIDRAIAKYPYDPRRAQQILDEAGFRAGSDGILVAPPELGGEPMRIEAWYSAGSDEERENAILTDSLRRIGIDAISKVTPVAMVRDAQARATTPGISTGGMGSSRFLEMTSDSIPRPETRWQGNNRGAWSNGDYDRFYRLYSTTLDRNERIGHLAQMERTFTEEVGAIPYLFTIVVMAHTANLKGPVMRKTPDGGIGTLRADTWEWTS